MALALQFHLEASEASVRAMCEGEKEALACAPAGARGGESGSVGIAAATLIGDPPRYAAMRPLLDDILDRLTAPRAEFRDRSGATVPRTT